MTVTRAKKNRNTASAVLSTSVLMGVRPVCEPGQQRGDRHPGELIPIEERESEEHRIIEIVEGHPQQPDIRQEQEPKAMRYPWKHRVTSRTTVRMGNYNRKLLVCPRLSAVVPCSSTIVSVNASLQSSVQAYC